jgi:hypothetical protein
LALPILLHGNEKWAVKSKDKSRLTAAEIKFMWKTVKYTGRDHKTNKEILTKVKVTSILDKITNHKTEWIQHVNQMPWSGLPNLLKKYAPRGKKIRSDHRRGSLIYSLLHILKEQPVFYNYFNRSVLF